MESGGSSLCDVCRTRPKNPLESFSQIPRPRRPSVWSSHEGVGAVRRILGVYTGSTDRRDRPASEVSGTGRNGGTCRPRTNTRRTHAQDKDTRGTLAAEDPVPNTLSLSPCPTSPPPSFPSLGSPCDVYTLHVFTLSFFISSLCFPLLIRK